MDIQKVEHLYSAKELKVALERQLKRPISLSTVYYQIRKLKLLKNVTGYYNQEVLDTLVALNRYLVNGHSISQFIQVFVLKDTKTDD